MQIICFLNINFELLATKIEHAPNLTAPSGVILQRRVQLRRFNHASNTATVVIGVEQCRPQTIDVRLVITGFPREIISDDVKHPVSSPKSSPDSV